MYLTYLQFVVISSLLAANACKISVADDSGSTIPTGVMNARMLKPLSARVFL